MKKAKPRCHQRWLLSHQNRVNLPQTDVYSKEEAAGATAVTLRKVISDAKGGEPTKCMQAIKDPIFSSLAACFPSLSPTPGWCLSSCLHTERTHNIKDSDSPTQIYEACVCATAAFREPPCCLVSLSGKRCLFRPSPASAATRDSLNGGFCCQQLHLKNVPGKIEMQRWLAQVCSAVILPVCVLCVPIRPARGPRGTDLERGRRPCLEADC